MSATRAITVAALLPFVGLAAGAQSASSARRPITQDAYDQWKSISSPVLSNDGRWAIYTLTPEVGEGTFVARATSGSTEYRHDRGFVARPNLVPSARGGFIQTAAAITADSRWAIFTIEPPRDAVEVARRAKKRPSQQPKAGLGIMDLTTGQATTVSRVRSFRVPRDRGAFVAYLLEADSATAQDSASRTPAMAAAGYVSSPSNDTSKIKQPGTPLVLRNLSSGDEVRIPDVSSYAFSDSGTVLTYAVSTKDGATDGVYLRSLSGPLASGSVTTLVAGAGRYQSLTLDRAGKQIAFLTDKDEYPREKGRYALYYYRSSVAGPARPAVTHDSVTGGLLVAPNGTLQFSRNGEALLFGVGPEPIEALPADSLTERAVFDLWSYNDPFLQPSQQVAAAQLRAPWYTSIYWPTASSWVKLGNDSTNDVRVGEDAQRGFAVSIYPYAVQGMWGDLRYDVFLVDAKTGKWSLVKQRMMSTGGDAPGPSRSVSSSDIQYSPNGAYVLMWDKNRWVSYNAATGKSVDLTSAIPGVQFDNETDDHPAAANPWGVAGWTIGEKRVLVNDRWDVWAIDPTGAERPRNVTGGVGRAKHIVFRVTRVGDRDETFINPSKPLLLSATNDDTKESGIWTATLSEAKGPQPVIMMPKRFTLLAKARDADQYLATEQTFTESPDLWTGPSLISLTRISDANPQQKNYAWGTAELVSFKNSKGVPLKGILYKPDGFDPRKKYPLIVYIYEKLSQGLYNYDPPVPNSANITPTTYVSKGYLVLEPDIVYTNGHPGESALSAVVPAVQSVIAKGFVDPKRVGLQGHSWGGYQAAYMVTRTNIFRAVSAGAPVANMTSAYGGIRWGAGVNRSMQYEKTQSRIGATPWDRPDLYLENSPLFHLPKVQTPLLLMHDDNDGAVPWYQGIELFIGLRRLGKEAYLFDYNGDDHGTTKRANGMDWDMRVQQFFDHYLMGAARPEWMDKGIPYTQKGRNQSPVVVSPKISPLRPEPW